tara:strand:+ start:584 stop:910 length:327 start_codon:yes stop_codon:yes gene_type:complete
MSEYVTLYREIKTLRAERFVARATTTRERARVAANTRARHPLADSREGIFSPSSVNDHGRGRRSRVPDDAHADGDTDGDQVVATPTTNHASIRRARRRRRARGGDARE